MTHLYWIIPLIIIVIISFVFLLKLDKKERDSGKLPVFLRDDIIVPDEIKGFNWGAFLLGPIWVIGNKISIGLVVVYLIPIGNGLLQLAYSIGLGFEANKLAWKSKKWDSVEEFKEEQRKWAKAGFITTPIAIALFSGLYLFILYYES